MGVEEGQVGVRLVAVGTVGGLVPVLGPGPATAAVRGLHTVSVAGGGGGCQVGRLGPPTPEHPILTPFSWGITASRPGVVGGVGSGVYGRPAVGTGRVGLGRAP